MIDHYDPHIVTAQDYYPFGMLSRVALPNNNKSYRFGFNGQEMNNDVKGGLGNSYTAPYWEYDGRIGKRWNLDPKPNLSLSPYSCFANNPLLYSDHLGDSIPTKFYGQDGKQSNIIPTQVQKMYNDEYGIKVGYANGKLYKTGDYKTDKKVSPLAKKSWEVLLGKDNTDKTLTFGHNLTVASFDNNGNLIDSYIVEGGVNSMNKKNSFIDLADFDAQGKVSGFEYSKEFNVRAFNLARVVEHEYIGHSIWKCSDDPNIGELSMGRLSPGPNEDNLNVMRSQMGLPLRLTYSGVLQKSTGVGILFGIYDKKGLQEL